MAAQFAGKKYVFDASSSVNFDEYMKAVGVNLVWRKLGNLTGHTTEFTIVGDVYTLATTSIVKNFHITFKLGEEFEEETADGRKVKSVMTADGNKLVQLQTLDGGKTTTIVREFSATGMLVTMTFENIVSTRNYKVA